MSTALLNLDTFADEPPDFSNSSLCRWLSRKNNTINCDDNDDDIENEDKPVYCPNRNELFQIIETMQKFSLFSKDSAIVQCHMNRVARITDEYFAEKSRQISSRFFLKNSAFTENLTALSKFLIFSRLSIF